MTRRRSRKAMNQINVVPYLDVMLVLLVIFMVTAPFINPAQVELPRVGKSVAAPPTPLEVVVRRDGSLLLRDVQQGGAGEPVLLTRLSATIQARQQAENIRPVVISADRNVRYDVVMRVMDTLQSTGVARVGLLVKPAQP